MTAGPRLTPLLDQFDWSCERLAGRLTGPVMDSGDGSSTPVGAAPEPGGTGSRRLLLTDSDSGVLHYALVTNRTTAPSASLLSAARSELATWVAQKFG